MKLFVFIFIALVSLPSCSVLTHRISTEKTIENYEDLKKDKIDIDVIERYNAYYYDEINEEGSFRSPNKDGTILKLSKNGYNNRYFLWPQKKNIGIYIDYPIAIGIIGFSSLEVFFSNSNLPILGYMGFGLGGSIIAVAERLKYNNAKEFMLPDNLFTKFNHPKELKYMSFDKVEIDVDSTSSSIYRPTLKFNKTKLKREKQADRKIEQIYSPDIINQHLRKSGYLDTTNILSSNLNELSIDATIYQQKSIHFKHLDDVVKYEFKIRYDFKESFTDSILFTLNDTITTDFHHSEPRYKEELIHQSVIRSFYKVIENEKDNKRLLKQKIEEEYKDSIFVQADSIATFYGDAISACVTVKVDKGHGSGFFISNDGYIITNLHVVGNSENIEVLLNDGRQLDAQLIRQSVKHDLALIKVDVSEQICLKLDQKDDIDITHYIGENIFVIGTPNNIQLGQSVSRGVVSGYRNYQDAKYYQTDASINGGNSGGPLMLENGTVLGVVNAKLVGANIERIGFAIPSKYILEALKLKYF